MVAGKVFPQSSPQFQAADEYPTVCLFEDDYTLLKQPAYVAPLGKNLEPHNMRNNVRVNSHNIVQYMRVGRKLD